GGDGREVTDPPRRGDPPASGGAGGGGRRGTAGAPTGATGPRAPAQRAGPGRPALLARRRARPRLAERTVGEHATAARRRGRARPVRPDRPGATARRGVFPGRGT